MTSHAMPHPVPPCSHAILQSELIDFMGPKSNPCMLEEVNGYGATESCFRIGSALGG